MCWEVIAAWKPPATTNESEATSARSAAGAEAPTGRVIASDLLPVEILLLADINELREVDQIDDFGA